MPTVGIIGLSYVGLPLALAFVESGCRVLGFDVDAAKVDAMRRGESPIRHIPSERVAAARASGGLLLPGERTWIEARREADALLICVPTPLDATRQPDLSCVRAAVESVARSLRPGQLVVLESTTYPGTTREVLLPALSAGGLTAGEGFFLAYSPERDDPGNARWGLRNTPKLVAGLTPACAQRAAELYGRICEVVPVSSPEVAELAKLQENTYRAVNIALANELKVLCHRTGLDPYEVTRAAATKPFGYQPFYPGPGVGGHCIPLDPMYLAWRARQSGPPSRIVELADEVNRSMPGYVVSRVAEALNDEGRALRGARILLLGVAYKPDVEDVRESPALEIIALLRARGAIVAYHDPHVPALDGVQSVDLSPGRLFASDCVVIVTHHAGVAWGDVARHARLVVDSRDALAAHPGPARVVPA